MTYADLLDQLTLEEKIGLLDGADLWRTKQVERLGIPSIMLSDGPHGLRVQYDEGDHLGREGSEPATCFPPAVAIAASWNRKLACAVGAALANEARAAGVSVILGPGLNLKRTPLCGRNFEYYSEDPLLAGELARHLAAGVQSRGVGATLKHFAANNQETERMSISVKADERTLREMYLSGFERAIGIAQPWAVMCSYNRINGAFASEDPWLLTQVLRNDWGFDGFVVSDWGAVSRRDRAVAAGLDLEMPSSSGIGSRTIARAVAEGTLSEAEVEVAARRVLQLVDRATTAAAEIPAEPLDLERQRDIAYRAAVEGAVLLKNDGLLPIHTESGGAVSVIGELARTARNQGAGSSKVNSRRVEAALPALQAALGTRGVVFASGYRLDGQPDEALATEAVAAAVSAEIAVVFLGIPEQAESGRSTARGLTFRPTSSPYSIACVQ